uniref:probable ATP-dependent RNA helicase DDX28 isoform X2 n=1 Tax=Myxine glutinosa TaxID=7769 RepID=UPI00358FD87F
MFAFVLTMNVGRKLVCPVTSFWCLHPRVCSACCSCPNPRRGSVTTSRLASTEKEDPVIRVPYWMQRKLDQLNARNTQKPVKIFEASNDKLLIQARLPNLNQHSSKQYKKLDYPPLVSKGWKRKKYSGDHFTIKKTKENPMEPIVSEDGMKSVMPSFNSLGVSAELQQIIGSFRIHVPTPIQVQTIPHVMKGSHVLCAAETGCGKTLCYMLPLIQRLNEDELNFETEIQKPRAIVLVPSRELLDQVTNIARSLTRDTHLKVLSIGGGRGMTFMRKFLQNKTIDVLVGTPGVVCKGIRQGALGLDSLRFLVIDEVDTMLDDSFSPLVQEILENVQICPVPTRGVTFESARLEGAQLILTGATFPKGLDNILSKVMDASVFVTVKSQNLHCIPSHVIQTFMRLRNYQKLNALLELLKNCPEQMKTGNLVFCNKASTVNWLGYVLEEKKIPHSRLHGSMSAEVSHIINYEFPPSLSDYIHEHL